MSIEVELGTAVADFATVVTGLLDDLNYDEVSLLPDRKQLDLVADLLAVQSRLSGVVHTVFGQVDRGEAAMAAHGVPTVSWLASELRYTRGQRPRCCTTPTTWIGSPRSVTRCATAAPTTGKHKPSPRY